MKTLLNKIGKSAKNFALATMLAAPLLFSSYYAKAQTPSKPYTNQTKAEQVDTAQNNQPTPDSIIYDPFNAQNLISGALNNDNFYKQDSAQKVQKFVQDIKDFINLFPNYQVTGNNGKPVLIVNEHDTCDWYTTAANIYINGERNFQNDNTLINFKGVSDIRDTLIKYNGHVNDPHKYANTTEADGVHHSLSEEFLYNFIDQNLNLNQLCFVNSNTADLAGPGTAYMNPKYPVSVDWVGYNSDGTYRHIRLVTFLPKDPNTTKTYSEATANDWYTAYMNPQLHTINGKTISTTADIPTDISYSSDWTSKLEKAVTNTTNQDTTATIHTDDGTTKVDISYFIRNKFFYPDTTQLHNTDNGTVPVDVIDTVEYVQKGTRKNTLHNQTYYTILKKDIVKQIVNVTKSTTGLFDHKANSSIFGIKKAWPNPIRAGGELYLDFNSKSRKLIELDIYNLSGKKIITCKKRAEDGVQRLEISIQNLTPGVYFLRFDEQSVKFVVK